MKFPQDLSRLKKKKFDGDYSACMNKILTLKELWQRICLFIRSRYNHFVRTNCNLSRDLYNNNYGLCHVFPN